MDFSGSSGDEGIRVVNSNFREEIFEALSNYAFVSVQRVSSHTLSAGVLIRALFTERQLATLAASGFSFGVATVTALRGLDAVSIVSEESAGAFNTVLGASVNALFTGGVALDALFSVAIAV